MLFSVIAMVAFTVSTNAANEVVESVEVLTNSSTPCASSYSSNVEVLIGIGYSEDVAKSIAFTMFLKCLENTHGPLPGTGKDSPTKEATPKQTETISPR